MLKINNLSKSFGRHKVLSNITFNAVQGEVIALIGPSGSGKSTILRCINSLEKHDQGTIELSNEERVGMVFQHFNLFQNMDLLNNLIYPQMSALGRSLEQSKARAEEMLESMNLDGLGHKMPHHLSGGQKQRGAIARTLCLDPSIILFDEPTSALDPENVAEVLNAIKHIANTNITMLIVTHEMSFARDLSDRVLFLDKGVILEDTPTKEFFINPKTERAQIFLNTVL